MSKITRIIKTIMERKAQIPEEQERWYELIYHGSIVIPFKSQEEAEKFFREELEDNIILEGIAWDSLEIEDRGPVEEKPPEKPWEPRIKLSQKASRARRTASIRPGSLSQEELKEKLKTIWSRPDEQ